ncbi:MAG TPA: hypothetical protein VGM98_15655 [Schlesneria sp.]|jgi:hypothetical protein
MTTNDRDLALNPDLFASEVHFCLLNDGVRSRSLRRLWRIAKGDSELERILEIKVAEFRRAMREGRTPTLWNMPTRTFEWLTENARFTPPREVLTTLAYVAVMLVGMDALKSEVPWSRVWSGSGHTNSSTLMRPSYESDADLFRSPSVATMDASSKVDEWLVAELKRAADSSDWSQAMARRLAESLDKLPLNELLIRKVTQATEEATLQQMNSAVARDFVTDLDTGALAKQVAESLRTALSARQTNDLAIAILKSRITSLDWKLLLNEATSAIGADPVATDKLTAALLQTVELADAEQQVATPTAGASNPSDSTTALRQSVQAAISSDVFEAAVRKSVQNWVASDEFRTQLTAAVQKAQAKSKPAVTTDTTIQATTIANGGAQ